MGWSDVTNPYANLDLGLLRWEGDLIGGFRFKFSGEDQATFIRKVYAIAGTDAHGDFNYATGLRTSALSHAQRPLFAVLGRINAGVRRQAELIDLQNAITDNAFGKIRTHILAPPTDQPNDDHVESMNRGQALMTNGPLVDFFFDTDVHFVTENGVNDWYAKQTDPKEATDQDALMGGDGEYDARRTLLFTTLGNPVMRYRWTNSEDFGGAVKAMGLRTVYPGAQSTAQVTPLPDKNTVAPIPPSKLVPPSQLGAFPLPYPGPPEGDIGAHYLMASTVARLPVPLNFQRGEHFCITNPIWSVAVKMDPFINPPRTATKDGPYVNAQDQFFFPADSMGFEIRLDLSLDREAFLMPGFKLVNDQGNTAGGGNAEPLALKKDVGDSHRLRFRNIGLWSINLRANPQLQYPSPGKVTFVFMLERPTDVHGNQLNAIALPLEVDWNRYKQPSPPQ